MLRKADVGQRTCRTRTPRPRRCASREYYRYEIDTTEVAEVWRRGSVIASWLLDLTAAALARGPEPRRLRRPGLRLRRGPLDDHGRHRRERPGPRADRRPVRALQLPRRGRLRGPDPVGHAQAVRRARREGGRRSRGRARRRPGPVRHQRRPGAQEALLLALRPGAARPAPGHPRGRRRLHRLGRRAAPGARAPGARGGRPRDRRGRVRPPRRRPALRAGRLPGPGPVHAHRGGARRRDAPASATWRSRPACSRPWSRGSPRPAINERGRVVAGEALRARPGLGPGAQRGSWARASPRARSSASTTSWARSRSRTSWSSGSPTRSSSRSGTATSSRASRSPWPRRSASRAGARSTTRWARSGTSCRTTCSRSSACWPWSRRSPRTPTRSATSGPRCMKAIRPFRPDNVVRGQYAGYRDEPGVAPDSDTETFVAVRLRDRLLALGRRALRHPGRQAHGRDAHRGRGRVPPSAAAALRGRPAAAGAQPAAHADEAGRPHHAGHAGQASRRARP